MRDFSQKTIENVFVFGRVNDEYSLSVGFTSSFLSDDEEEKVMTNAIASVLDMDVRDVEDAVAEVLSGGEIKSRRCFSPARKRVVLDYVSILAEVHYLRKHGRAFSSSRVAFNYANLSTGRSVSIVVFSC